LEVIEAGSIKRYQPGYRFLWNPGIQAIFLRFLFCAILLTFTQQLQ
tara:strand:- start:259 stop:396 length:138 start_codon:yes stop_codon:yes gene_type:complete